MADPIRCPMCGKQNPAELDACQYCQARLKPLVAPSSDENETTPPEPEEELPDWLRSLRQTGPFGLEDEAGPESGESPAEDAEPSDWLASLRTSGQEDEELNENGETLANEATPSGEGTQWSPGDQAGEAPDWRADLGFSDENPEEDETREPGFALPPEEEPEWLLRIRSRHKEDSAGQELFQFPGEEPPASGWGAASYTEPSEEDNEPAQGLPEWLSGFNTPSASDEPETPAGGFEPEAQPNLNADLPDWLREFTSTAPDETPAAAIQPDDEQPTTQPASDGDAADWPSAFTTPAPADGEDEPLPEWLSQAGAAELGEAGGGDAGAENTEAEGADTEDAEAGEAKAAPSEENQAPKETSWLDEIGAVAFDSTSEKEDLPPAFSGVAPFEMDEDGQTQIDPLNEEALPDWLVHAALQDGQGETKTPPPAEESEEHLAHAELPTWLEAMRPVEAQTLTPDSDATVGTPERVGPLAGLRGVLPAEADISQARKPPVYSVKLHVSDGNQEHANLLSQMIQAEGEARALPDRPVISSQYLLRLIIFLTLLAAMGLVVFVPGLVQGLPASTPVLSPELVAASRLVTELQTGEPVLLAFDYQPAYSGEMDAAAGSILDHLMVKGAFLTLVSTTPTGPVQAERLIGSVVQRTGHTYLPSQQYANLGYIPGGAAGLLSFAQSPAQTVPFTLEGESAWETGPLQPVAALSDFAMVIVMTENPETARNWIEQVQPALGGTPLIMVVSAQAEPLVRPYYAGRPQQVQGMVTGLAGGAAYESLTGRQGPASAYWTPFSFGVLLTAVLILIGGIASAVLGLNDRRKQATEGGRQP